MIINHVDDNDIRVISFWDFVLDEKIGNVWPTFLLLIFLLIHGHDAKAILRDDGIYLANLRGPQNVVIGLLVSKIYPDKKIGNLFNRAAEKGNLWRKFILLETEADEVVMG